MAMANFLALMGVQYLVLISRHCCMADFELVVLHTNDVHARVAQANKYGAVCKQTDADQGLCYGGVARRKTAIDTERGNHDNVLLLDAGDQLQGTVWYNRYKGLEASHFMNLLEYDAMVSVAITTTGFNHLSLVDCLSMMPW